MAGRPGPYMIDAAGTRPGRRQEATAAGDGGG